MSIKLQLPFPPKIHQIEVKKKYKQKDIDTLFAFTVCNIVGVYSDLKFLSKSLLPK